MIFAWSTHIRGFDFLIVRVSEVRQMLQVPFMISRSRAISTQRPICDSLAQAGTYAYDSVENRRVKFRQIFTCSYITKSTIMWTSRGIGNWYSFPLLHWSVKIMKYMYQKVVKKICYLIFFDIYRFMGIQSEASTEVRT